MKYKLGLFPDLQKTMKRVKGVLRAITTAIEKAEVENNSRPKPFISMPGPKPLPVIKNIWRYFPVVGSYDLQRIHHTYAKLYEEYGPIVREHVYGDRILVHVYDPVDMATVYNNEGKRPVRQSHTVLARYRRERPEKYSCPGLFPSNGEEWYQFRHLFQKILMAPTTGEACSSDIENITEDLMAVILAQVDKNFETDLQPLLFRWALECIGAVTLNRRLGCLGNGNKEVLGLVEAVHKTHMAVFQTENTPLKYKESYKILTESQDYVSSLIEKYLDEAMEQVRQGKHEDSVLARMMNAENATKKDIFTMILDMFIAGIDTTAYALAFAFYNLAKNPDVQDKLRQEVISALPEKHSRVSDRRYRMPYLQLVIKETLRVNPIAVGNGRVTNCDLVLGGYHVPAKTTVILQHQIASKLDKNFPNADRFYPERWTDHETPLVSSPFGYGPRLCIGSRIARKEMQLAIARIVRNFSLSYHHEEIDSFNKLINVPDKPVLLRFEPLPC